MIAFVALSCALLLAFVLCCVVLGWSLDVYNPPAMPADVALVFGCGEPWKADARLRQALAVHQAGLAPHLIVSGGVRMPGRATTEAEWFRDWLVERGVPPERVHLENRATNTAENAEFSWPILEAHGWRRVILVMSDFEGLRAHLTARRAWLGKDVTLYDMHASSAPRWSRWGWWTSAEGWRLTNHTVPRLFRYGLLPYLWRR
ncbi:hypothetical protein TBR22_A34810 [Luteitalea sp. TBR-22]|uniref:YdcF family protein n=1 Tax=Luteitalea sp. TBR-22 TaxID=2802971 RepID=UPI001AFB7B13|nr:YdcF family protein [Luteitalea sp. TBR-22]BCS34252.1 hypothetical protein TBR22_A34810 [Luteitalea sp. TBR-22]